LSELSLAMEAQMVCCWR